MRTSASRCMLLAAVMLAALAAPASAQDCLAKCDRDFEAAVEKCVRDTPIPEPPPANLAPPSASFGTIEPPSSAEDVVREDCRKRGQPSLDQCKAKCSPSPPSPPPSKGECQAQCDIDFKAAVQKCVDDTKISGPERESPEVTQDSLIPPIQPPTSAEDVVRRDCTQRGQPLLKDCKDKCNVAPPKPNCRENCRNQFKEGTRRRYRCIRRC